MNHLVAKGVVATRANVEPRTVSIDDLAIVNGLSGWWGVGLLVLAAGMAIYGLIGFRRRRQSLEVLEVAERKLAEANVIKNDFVAMVSHELRTPLTSIKGFADTLSSWRDLPAEEVDEFLSVIEIEAAKLAAIVEDVLVIPRLEANRLRLDNTMFDLTAAVQETVDLVFPGADRKEMSFALPRGIQAWGDERRVRQVVQYLLANAREHGGNQVLVEGFVSGEHFVVVVSDNGRGIPGDGDRSIFEHFEQLSKGDGRTSGGLGLGLPIARRLARAMGGEVWYERRFPTGSRFCFSITQSPESAERVMVERAERSQQRTSTAPAS